jgi:vanillin dehydrogenase
MNNVELLINGKSIAPAHGRSFHRVDPVKNRPTTRAVAAEISDVQAAVSAAADAFPTWAAIGPAKRRDFLLRAMEKLVAYKGKFIECMISETGATEGWAAFNVDFGSSLLREAASITTQITGEIIPSDVPDNIAMAFRQPLGVCVGIAPWNAPVILGVRALAVPLACGNTVVFKASEACPAVHSLIGTALAEAGLPDGVVNVITNAPEDAPQIVGALIDHPSVRHINFTGSTRVGRIVAERAAKHLKPVLLELGGKAPLVVLDDADLDAAVNAASFGAFLNQGQICMSTDRIVVDSRVANEFVQRLSEKAGGLVLRDPSEGPTVLGSVVDSLSASRISELVEDAANKGARITSGGKSNGTLLQATVVDHVTPKMDLYSQEAFGPVVAIIRVKDDEEAIRVANDTGYGLSAAVFSRDISRAWKVALRLESGICHVNGPTVHDEPQMPFGGVKSSGYGRFGGKAAINEFTVLRWITVQTGVRHYPF